MINSLVKTLEIDIAYSVNSFIYILRKLPIFKDLITEDAYSSKLLKKIIGLFGVIFSLLRAIFLKFMYYFVIFFICYKFFQKNFVSAYFHIYFFLTLLGMFINNKLLNTSKKKYFAIILFNMDATKFFHANIFWNTINNLIFNSACIIFFNTMMMSPSIKYSFILIIYTTFIRFIGETLNIIFYKKYNYIWYSNTNIYYPILIILLGISCLPFFGIYIPFKAITIITLIVTILGIISLIYLLKIKDYKLIYKKLSETTKVMNSKNDKDYLRQAMVEVKKKDIKIPEKKLKGKTGYEYFNTIFFERHKEILVRSAKFYSVVFTIIYLVLIYLVLKVTKYDKTISYLLHNRLAIFIFIMYFINRGAIITQAMFFNCDHAMLSYNFYREPDTIIALFKKRLKIVIKVNLLPATIIGAGNLILLIILKEYNPLVLLSMFIFIILLSIFFSTYYLVIYYLLQPFDKKLEVKKASYSFVTLITYIICFQLFDLVLDTKIISLIGILITFLFIILSLKLVYKLAPKTFKLN